MNKLGKIILASATAVVIGIGGYFLLQFLLSPTTPQDTSTPPDNQVKITASEEVEALTDDVVFDFWTSPKTKEIYYVSWSGRISKITPEGTTQSLTSQTIPNLNNVDATSDGSAAIIGFGYPQTPSFSVFNASKRSFQPMPAGTTAADWSPSSNNIVVYLQNSGSSSQLKTLDLGTGKSTELLKVNQKDLSIEWAFPESIYLYQRPSDQTPNSLWSYDIKSKTIKKLAEEKELSIKWWPEKELGLKWSNGRLSIINKASQQIFSVNLKTLPDKCFLGEPLMYCGSANEQRSIVAGNLASETLKKSSTAEESIYSIISFDFKQSIDFPPRKIFDGGESDVPFRAARIEKQTDRLLILNELDHKLYSLPL